MPGAWNSLGVVRYQTKAPADACAAWERAIELDGTQFDALYNLALVSMELGRRHAARRALERFVADAPPERYAPDLDKARALLRRLPA